MAHAWGETLAWLQKAARSRGSWFQSPLKAWVWSSALGCVWMAVGDRQPGFRQVAGSRCSAYVRTGPYAGGSASMVSRGQKAEWRLVYQTPPGLNKQKAGVQALVRNRRVRKIRTKQGSSLMAPDSCITWLPWLFGYPSWSCLSASLDLGGAGI